MSNGKPQERLRFRALRGKTLAFKKTHCDRFLRFRDFPRCQGLRLGRLRSKKAVFCVCVSKPAKTRTEKHKEFPPKKEGKDREVYAKAFQVFAGDLFTQHCCTDSGFLKIQQRPRSLPAFAVLKCKSNIFCPVVGVWIGGAWNGHFPESEKCFSDAEIYRKFPDI